MYVPIYTVITEPDFNLKEKILGNIIRTDKKITEQMKKAHMNIWKNRNPYIVILW